MGWETVPVTRHDEVKKRNFVTTVTSRSICWNPEVPIPDDSKETVRTGDAGQADLRFHDSSNLTVGPKSSVRLDKLVYDPNKSASTVAIQATKGSFRFVTGSQGAGAVQVKTPYGTLGVRG